MMEEWIAFLGCTIYDDLSKVDRFCWCTIYDGRVDSFLGVRFMMAYQRWIGFVGVRFMMEEWIVF